VSRGVSAAMVLFFEEYHRHQHEGGGSSCGGGQSLGSRWGPTLLLAGSVGLVGGIPRSGAPAAEYIA
jgi:hypothetical protein